MKPNLPHKILWHPGTPIFVIFWLGYRLSNTGFHTITIINLTVCIFWLFYALKNKKTKGGWLKNLYIPTYWRHEFLEFAYNRCMHKIGLNLPRAKFYALETYAFREERNDNVDIVAKKGKVIVYEYSSDIRDSYYYTKEYVSFDDFISGYFSSKINQYSPSITAVKARQQNNPVSSIPLDVLSQKIKETELELQNNLKIAQSSIYAKIGRLAIN